MKKRTQTRSNNKIIAGVCSGIAKYLTLTLSLFALFGLQRSSYLEQVSFLHHLLDYYPEESKW